MQDVEDEPLFADRAAGIDIAKAGIEVTIRVPSDIRAGARQQETRSFATTRRDLMALADWLRSWGVTKVVDHPGNLGGSSPWRGWSHARGQEVSQGVA